MQEEGNGKTGRFLVQAVQVRRLSEDAPGAPISFMPAAYVDAYISSLGRYCEGDLKGYIEFFSQAMSNSVGHMNF